ncbi:sensor histidine kinase, partial [Staphylococcus warneri]
TNTHHKHSVNLINEINDVLNAKRKEVVKYKQQELLLNQEITNISHDIRTPLTAIKGYANLMQEIETIDEINRYAKVINSKTDNLINMVDLFHEMTKLNSGDYALNIQEINIDECLKEQFLSYFNQFDNKSINVLFNEDGTHLVKADRVCLERIINNLISNILKYGKTYAKIKVFDNKDRVLIEIQNDTDEPLSDGDQTNLFKRSQTLDASRHNGSTGLGLYMVKRLVEVQNGRITAAYQNNQFNISIELPRVNRQK